MEVHGAGNAGFFHPAKAVMGGEIYNVALLADGTVWSWGWNAFGQLGNGTTNDSWVPAQTGLTATPPLTNVVKLGGRPYFTLAEKADGTVWAWGMNQFGQMGNGTRNRLSRPQVTVPVLVSNSLPGGPINGAGADHLRLPVRRGARDERHGVDLGQRHARRTRHGHAPNYIPVPVPGLTNIIAISGGWFHLLALQSNGLAGRGATMPTGNWATAPRSTVPMPCRC